MRSQSEIDIRFLDAAHEGNLDRMKELIWLGANPSYVKVSTFHARTSSATPFQTLFYEAKGQFEKYRPSIDYFIDELHIDINQVDAVGNTVAHVLARDDRYVEALDYLIPKGIDLLKCNHDGKYPIDYALTPTRQFQMVDYLVKKMPSIPRHIAIEIISRNHLKDDETNRMIAEKSGDKNLINQLVRESEQLSENLRRSQQEMIDEDREYKSKISQKKIELDKFLSDMLEKIQAASIEDLSNLRDKYSAQRDSLTLKLKSSASEIKIASGNFKKSLMHNYPDEDAYNSEESVHQRNLSKLNTTYSFTEKQFEVCCSIVEAVNFRIKNKLPQNQDKKVIVSAIGKFAINNKDEPVQDADGLSNKDELVSNVRNTI